MLRWENYEKSEKQVQAISVYDTSCLRKLNVIQFEYTSIVTLLNPHPFRIFFMAHM